MTESLFPGYIFGRFNWQRTARQISYAPGVAGLIHFGRNYPVVPLEIIQELQETFKCNKPAEVDHPIKIGDTVLIESGSMRGVEGVVCRILPGKRRIALLFEFLGRQTQVEIQIDQVQPTRNLREGVF